MRKGRICSPETRAKMRESAKNRLPISEKTRMKMSLSQKNNHHHMSEENKIKLRIANFGHPRSNKTRIKLSKSAKERWKNQELRNIQSKTRKRYFENSENRNKQRNISIKQWENLEILSKISGPNHHAWRGGTRVPYGLEFGRGLREMIRKRDDFLCQNPRCYVPENGKKHQVHHVDFNKNHNGPINLITLCNPCHAKTINGDRDYWIDFYRNLQEMRGITC